MREPELVGGKLLRSGGDPRRQGAGLLMLDLCSGLGGASAAMRDRGWRVVRLDIEGKYGPDVVGDVRSFTWGGVRPDLVWASPPCIEFSRESRAWTATHRLPDFSLVGGCLRVIRECKPRFWILENVKGAVRWFGPPQAIVGAFYLWGRFPMLGSVRGSSWKAKRQRPDDAAWRAAIPYRLSWCVARAVELQLELPLEPIAQVADLLVKTLLDSGWESG
jgi:hypothetical protein